MLSNKYAPKGVRNTSDVCYRWSRGGTCNFFATHATRCKYKHPARGARDPNDPLIDDRPGAHLQNFSAAPGQGPPQGGYNAPVEYYQGGNEWGFYGNEQHQNYQQPPPQQGWGAPPPDQFRPPEMSFQPQGDYMERPPAPAQGYDPLRDGYDPVLMAATSAPPPTTYGMQHPPQQPPMSYMPPHVDQAMPPAFNMAPPTDFYPPPMAAPPPPPTSYPPPQPPPPIPPAPFSMAPSRPVPPTGVSAPLATSKAIKLATKLSVPPNPQCPTWQATKRCSQAATTCPHFHPGMDCPSFYCNHTCPSGSSCKMAHRSYHELMAKEIERKEREGVKRDAAKAGVEGGAVLKKVKVEGTATTTTSTTTLAAAESKKPAPTAPKASVGPTGAPIQPPAAKPAPPPQPQPQAPKPVEAAELAIEEQPFGGILQQFNSMRCARELQSTVLALDQHLHPEVGQDFISMAVDVDRGPQPTPPTMQPTSTLPREDALRVRCAPATLVNLISGAPDQEHLQRAIHLFLA